MGGINSSYASNIYTDIAHAQKNKPVNSKAQK